ncbi:A1pp-domain-containing protein [Pleurotus eryngii]|uniref:A1pp-domain-containing protein n=1 Tax=Pleurotus eryngii TaxID=5323 RepID=A0A9P5ZZG8_PLEER|nr:A1pp-domain-containing protein [Pleurotus eryngii]
MIALKDIPTISQLYRASALNVAETRRYPSVEAHLDCISLLQGDITKVQVDAIVNAANRSLLVDGAIHDAAGPKLLAECRTLNGCETGGAKITNGYNLPALHVIHAVGPIYDPTNVETKESQLASCYRNCLDIAVNNSLKTIAFPCISTGIYGYPIEDATHVVLDVVRKFCDTEAGKELDRIVFVVWSNADRAMYEKLLSEYFPPDSE